jgi:glycosyltransferase involved in cell wall biosynthesis
MNRRNRILYLQYTNPAGYPPLEHSSQLLARSGWEVLFLGTGSFGSNALNFEESPRIRVRRLQFQPPGFRQKLHYLYFSIWCLLWTVRFRPAWIYASDMLACPAALLLEKVCGIPIIYHEHDAPTARSMSVFERLQFACRRACARRARACVIPNAERARIFAAEHGVTNILVVWNCPAGHEVGPEREPLNGGLRLLYHGSIVPERVPISIIDALARLPEHISLMLVGYETAGSRGYVKQLCDRAKENGVRHRLSYPGSLSRKELMKACRSCDVGLALVPGAEADINLEHLVGASNKVFDYLACGLPVIVPALPQWEELFVRSEYGVGSRSANASDLAAAIGTLCEHPIQLRAMGERGRCRVQTEWHYERQFQPVWNLLHDRESSPVQSLSIISEQV